MQLLFSCYQNIYVYLVLDLYYENSSISLEKYAHSVSIALDKNILLFYLFPTVFIQFFFRPLHFKIHSSLNCQEYLKVLNTIQHGTVLSYCTKIIPNHQKHQLVIVCPMLNVHLASQLTQWIIPGDNSYQYDTRTTMVQVPIITSCCLQFDTSQCLYNQNPLSKPMQLVYTSNIMRLFKLRSIKLSKLQLCRQLLYIRKTVCQNCFNNVFCDAFLSHHFLVLYMTIIQYCYLYKIIKQSCKPIYSCIA